MEAGPFKNAKSRCDKHEETSKREKNPHFCPVNGPVQSILAQARVNLSAGCRLWCCQSHQTFHMNSWCSGRGCYRWLAGFLWLHQPAVCETRYCEIPPLLFPLLSTLAGEILSGDRMKRLNIEMLMEALFNSAELVVCSVSSMVESDHNK